MNPQQLAAHLSGLGVAAKTLLDGLTIDWLAERAPGQLASQQKLDRPHKTGVKRQRPALDKRLDPAHADS